MKALQTLEPILGPLNKGSAPTPNIGALLGGSLSLPSFITDAQGDQIRPTHHFHGCHAIFYYEIFTKMHHLGSFQGPWGWEHGVETFAVSWKVSLIQILSMWCGTYAGHTYSHAHTYADSHLFIQIYQNASYSRSRGLNSRWMLYFFLVLLFLLLSSFAFNNTTLGISCEWQKNKQHVNFCQQKLQSWC